MPKGETIDSEAVDWRVESLRITVFPFPGATVSTVSDLWTGVTGAPPDTESSRPREGIHEASGPWTLGETSVWLTLIVSPAKLDLIATKTFELSSNLVASATLGPLEELIDAFEQSCCTWLTESSPDSIRIALGATLLTPVLSQEEGYATISGFLPFELDPAGSSDFLYRINRPRPSVLDTTRHVNRLSTWAVNRIVAGSIPIDSLEVGQRLTAYAGRLELDVNTVPTETVLSRESLCPMLNELVCLAKEIARHGDIP